MLKQVIVLVTLASCAWFLASGFTALAASRLQVEAVSPKHEGSSSARKPVPAAQIEDFLGWHADSVALRGARPPDRCPSDLRLVGTFVHAGDHDSSLALVSNENHVQLVHDGDVTPYGKARVDVYRVTFGDTAACASAFVWSPAQPRTLSH